MNILLENISKNYNKEIISNLSFSFPKMGTVCIFGKSGCGKTTILRIVAGLEKPDSGRVTGPEGLRFSCVFQEDRLIPWLSGRDNILFVNDNEEKCDKLLRLFKMYENRDKKPSELSGGMKQKIAIARALSYEFDVLLLDEPFKGLDLDSKYEIMDIIKESIKNRLCIFVTHDTDEVRRMSDYVLRPDGEPIRNLLEV